MIRLEETRPRRRPNLTPMIDVVLLLLVFFMMVSRFGGVQGVPLALAAPGGQVDWSGPPRLVDVLPQGVLLNGVPVAAEALATALAPLMAAPTDAEAHLKSRPTDGYSWISDDGSRRMHLDYCFISGGLTGRLKACQVDNSARGSDHFPVWVELAEA